MIFNSLKEQHDYTVKQREEEVKATQPQPKQAPAKKAKSTK